jgi:hypothetical protein
MFLPNYNCNIVTDCYRKRKEYVAVNLTTANLAKEAADVHVLEISKLLSACPLHNGFRAMRIMLNNFKI